jgi:sulfide:quinone oxidoreductase
MNEATSPTERFNVVIVGGGVAAVEAALALREFGGDRISTSMIAPGHEFVYRPMSVREPFGYGAARRYPLEQIAGDLGAELHCDAFTWLDRAARLVHTQSGHAHSYDAVLLAMGARQYHRYHRALTLEDTRLDELLHGLIEDVEGGYVKELAFVIPSGRAWPLPIYELALMTAARACDMQVELSITIATPEDSPLAIFGLDASHGVQAPLENKGIKTVTSAHCAIPEPGRIVIHPGSREVRADRIVVLPELLGPAVAGVPSAGAGFIPVDVHGKVRGTEGVYAAGDATDFAVKHGGIAAQQADVAAQAIAALAGVAYEPAPFHPVIRGILLTGGEPLYLAAHITGGHGSSSYLAETASWSPPHKIAAQYLAPYLESLDRESVNVS